MRVWDISPGYLNRQSLLGEHNEIHVMLSVITNDLKGFSKHPETRRWIGHLAALRVRHNLVVAEMLFRGYTHQTPVEMFGKTVWPTRFLDPPSVQFSILRNKYTGKEKGRIALPRTTKELWTQHKFSVLARDPSRYRSLDGFVAETIAKRHFADLAYELVQILRRPPSEGRLLRALQHMLEYLPNFQDLSPSSDPAHLLLTIQESALAHRIEPLLMSTALSELGAW